MKIYFPLIVVLVFLFSCHEKKVEFVCPPCDMFCDTLSFNAPGICPHCNMQLVEKSTLFDESTLVLNDIQIETGSGVFLMEGTKDRTIKVYYHQPEKFNNESKILIVVPGAGRNGNEYRNAWIEASEKYNVLILSPAYNENVYPFEDYHLCGLIKDINLNESVARVENSNEINLNEQLFEFKINASPDEQIFNDFDRIFDLTINATRSSQTNYDIFGHSAGGQILHRFSIFHEQSKANRIIASNSGFYTLPDTTTALPFGIKNYPFPQEHLKNVFSKNLILLIGELDNESERNGTLLRSKTVDQQGLHRLERAQYFYRFSNNLSNKLDIPFNWKLEIVPNIGHDHERMAVVASKYLYD